MSRFFGKVCQNGYVVRDIEAALTHWTEVLGVGPFFYIDRVQCDWFTYVPVLSQPAADSTWAGLRGRVPVALAPEVYESLVGAPLSPGHSQVMLCGNPAMIDEVQTMLEACGFAKHSRKNPGQIHLERYW